jgi:hypothetical protein
VFRYISINFVSGLALVEKYRRYGLNYSRSWAHLRYVVGRQQIANLLQTIDTEGQSTFYGLNLKKNSEKLFMKITKCEDWAEFDECGRQRIR